ncbi:protein rolling stone-like [Pararge aegeria]|uniref:Jg19478 protein n=1 Tax=Pararge aegeria aegeria TaxID=348720 RepID=A0A8S4R8P8_9NEOP|nr:protein rolling stone-like [Pararge aegeria]CAH2231659.1 jg19478 [Pararge aegeria aegeria]
MGAIKNYFKQQFQSSMWTLKYESSSDFYLSCFQRGASPLPLLFIRGFLFLGGLSIILASIILTSSYGAGAYWPIYLTHWGLVFITVACGFGCAICYTAYTQGSIDDAFELPWYVKVYWVSYNIAIPLAFFITIFYWVFLANATQDFAVNFVLDIFIHAVNSVLVLILLLTARHPTNALHFYFLIVLSVIYIIFTVIYYVGGGTDPFGNVFIYPVLDWSNPGPSVVMMIISIVMVTIIHFITVLLTLARDALGRSCQNNNEFSLAY